MITINPGKVERQVHDEYITKWVYRTNDPIESIMNSENFLYTLNYSPEKILVGDEIIILSETPTGEMNKLYMTVGYRDDEEACTFFPIFTQNINLNTGKVTILSGLEDYLDDDTEEGDTNSAD